MMTKTKNLLLLICLWLSICSALGQRSKSDIIHRTDNTTIQGVVVEITDDIVRYRKPNEDAIYRISVKEISKIVYGNGDVEVYRKEATPKSQPKPSIEENKWDLTALLPLKWMISGGLDLTRLNFEGNGESQLRINPRLGYFIKKNIMAGAGFSIQTDKSFSLIGKRSYSSTESLRLFNVFGRYMHPLKEHKLYLWGEVGLGLGAFKITEDDEGESFSASQFQLGPGISLFLNEHIALEGMLRFSHTGIGSLLKLNETGLFGGIQIFF